MNNKKPSYGLKFSSYEGQVRSMENYPAGTRNSGQNAGKTAVSEKGGAQGGAIGLKLVSDAWPHLTEQARRDILAIVRREASQATR